jgi:hypothetical protein
MKIVAFVVIMCSSCWAWGMGMGLEDLSGKRLKKGQVRELLADKSWTRDERLTKFFGGGTTYVHPANDLVLAVDWDGKGGMLFSDKETVYRVVSDPDVLKPRHMLQGVFDHGQDFPAQSAMLSERLIAEVSTELGEPVDPNSMESLGLIDRYLAAKGAKKLLQPELFAGLLAYVGEVVRKNYPMKWSMSNTASGVWEPWLVDEAGNRYPIFAAVYRELYEYRPGRSSVHGVIVGELQKYKLLGAR